MISKGNMTSISSTFEGFFQWWEKSRALNPLLPTGLLALILSLLAAIWWFFGSIKGRQRSKVALPPGPSGLPLLGTLPFIDPELHRYFAALARTYGPIVSLRLGSRLCVVIGSASLAKEILRDQDAIFANHDESARAIAIRNGEQGLGWSPYNSHWRHLRKLAVGEMLSSGKLDVFSPDIRRRDVGRMVSRVHAQMGAPVAFGELLFVAMSNVITGMLWGGTLEEEEMGRVGEELRRVVEDILEVFARFDVFEFFPVLARFDILGVVRRTKKVAARLHEILDGVIDRRVEMDRLGEEGRGKDFLQLLTKSMKEKGDPKAPLTRSHIKALFTDLIMASVDTSMHAIEWVMAETLINPEVVKKAQEELQQIVGSGHTVDETHLPKLRYLNAIVKEALRLHPPVPLMLPRRPAQSSTVGGYFVPAGSLLFVNMWAIQRDPTVWDNPTTFQPERFLAGAGVGDFSGNDFRYFPFGSGRRICMGIPLADRMLTHVLGTLLHSFEWRLPEGAKPDLTEKFGITLKMATPFAAIASPKLCNQE